MMKRGERDSVFGTVKPLPKLLKGHKKREREREREGEGVMPK